MDAIGQHLSGNAGLAVSIDVGEVPQFQILEDVGILLSHVSVVGFGAARPLAPIGGRGDHPEVFTLGQILGNKLKNIANEINTLFFMLSL